MNFPYMLYLTTHNNQVRLNLSLETTHHMMTAQIVKVKFLIISDKITNKYSIFKEKT